MKIPSFITQNFTFLKASESHVAEVNNVVKVANEEIALEAKVGLKNKIIDDKLNGEFVGTRLQGSPELQNFSAQAEKDVLKASHPIHASQLTKKTRENTYVQPKAKLPKNNGDWGIDGRGIAGESAWYSDFELVSNITKGEPIIFKGGQPDLSPFAKETISFADGELAGNYRDLRKLYAIVAQKKGFKTKKAARLYIKNAGLTPVHHNKNEMLLVPSDLLKYNFVWQEAKVRLPKKDGQWGVDGQGIAGESAWHSTKKAVNGVTDGAPVVFRDGRPDFSPWATRSFKFRKAMLDGSDDDFEYIYAQIAKEMNFDSKAAAQKYLRNEGLTPHHLSETEIILVPKDLHDNVPHAGSASDMRNYYL